MKDVAALLNHSEILATYEWGENSYIDSRKTWLHLSSNWIFMMQKTEAREGYFYHMLMYIFVKGNSSVFQLDLLFIIVAVLIRHS